MAEFTMTIPADSISTTVKTTAEAATSQAIVSVATVSAFFVGDKVSGTNVPSNSTISSIDIPNKRITLNNNISTAIANNTTLTITHPPSDVKVTVDRGLNKKTKQRVLTAQFGDGYSQRVRHGINPKDDIFRVTFKNRSSAEINRLAKFFDNFAAKAFPFTVTDFDGETQMKVTCDDYSVSYIQTTVHNLSATFIRVYEP